MWFIKNASNQILDWIYRHAPSHKSGGADEILLNELGVPTGAVNFNNQYITHVQQLRGCATHHLNIYANVTTLDAAEKDIIFWTLDATGDAWVEVFRCSANSTTPTVKLAKTLDGNAQTISDANVTVGAGRTLDVSAGTLTLTNNQISGDKVEGGTIAAITISGLTATLAAQLNCAAQTLDSVQYITTSTSGQMIFMARARHVDAAFNVYTPGVAAGYADTLRLIIKGRAAISGAYWTACKQIFDTDSLPDGDPSVAGQLYYLSGTGVVYRSAG